MPSSLCLGSRNGVIGTVTGLQDSRLTDGSFIIDLGTQTLSEFHPTFRPSGISEFLSGGQCGRSVKLAIYLPLLLKLRIGGAKYPFPLMP